jgi:DNA-binding transcriptional LysR family regulator
MNLALIEAFSAVMKTGSTTRAAALLQISQPAVSRSVRRLGDMTKLKLFERSGQSWLDKSAQQR